jgi:hypothetical protein
MGLHMVVAKLSTAIPNLLVLERLVGTELEARSTPNLLP